MKKILSILSTLILIGSTTIALTNNANTHIKETKFEKNEKINWSDVKKSNNDYFNNFTKNKQKELKIYSSNDINKGIILAQKKVNKYIELFQNKNFTLKQIIEYLSNENKDFKEHYNKFLIKQDNFIVNQSNLINEKTIFSSNNDFPTLDNHVKTLRISKASFVTISATAAVSAAAFWSISWMIWPIHWAVGCTIVSTIAGSVAAGLNLALVKYDKTLSTINKATISAISILKLGALFPTIAWTTLITAQITLAGTSWAFTPSVVLIPLITIALAWMSIYR